MELGMTHEHQMTRKYSHPKTKKKKPQMSLISKDHYKSEMQFSIVQHNRIRENQKIIVTQTADYVSVFTCLTQINAYEQTMDLSK